jgi:hypothetical protein
MATDKNFMGRNGFVWFYGVVEDRIDPEYLGRVRVRAVGFHTDNKEKLPTSDLPWAQVILPVTSAGISGLGQSPSAFVEGSWVFGYFRDADMAQQPMIVGSVPGYPLELANVEKGFFDPNGVYPKYKNEVDTNRLAVNLKEDGAEINPHLSLTLRRSTRITEVATADFNPVTAADGSSMAADDGDTWNQPEIPYNAVYPYNKVFESESGHIREYDDTTGAERIFERHRTGTSYEIDKDGNKVDIIKGSHYTLTAGENKTLIEGDSDITINGRHKIYINKDNGENNDYTIQIGANANVNIQVDKGDINLVTVDGNVNVNSGGNYNLKVQGDMRVDVQGNVLETVEGTKTSDTVGAVIHRGSTIDLNP